jgi:hypothetical protein
MKKINEKNEYKKILIEENRKKKRCSHVVFHLGRMFLIRRV